MHYLQNCVTALMFKIIQAFIVGCLFVGVCVRASLCAPSDNIILHYSPSAIDIMA